MKKYHIEKITGRSELKLKTGITKTAPRISDKSAEFYRGTWGILNQGLEYVLDALPALYRYT